MAGYRWLNAVSVQVERHEAVPWRAILTSPPVWAIIVAHACSGWAGYTILTCIPTYMKEVLKFDTKKASVQCWDRYRKM